MNNKLLINIMSGLMCLGVVTNGITLKEKEVTNQAQTNDQVMFNNDIIPMYPGNGQVVSILKKPVLNYIKAMKSCDLSDVDDYKINNKAGVGVSIKDYYSAKEHLQKSKNITLIWQNAKNISTNEYKVYLSKEADLKGAKIYDVTNSTSLTINNLYSATTYYWKVTSLDNKYESDIASFITEDYTRMLSTENILNVRDIGGYMTSSGKRVKQGIIFRGAEVVKETYADNGSNHHQNVSENALKVFNEEMNIGVEIDFRGESESNYATTSDIGENVEYDRQSIGAYASFNRDSASSIAKFKDIFTKLSNANEKHVYFHCWGGADRTGTIGFLINGLLGVSYTDLIIDYELTSFSKNLRTRENMNNNVAYFENLVNELNSKYCDNGQKTISEGVELYLINKLGFSKQEVEQIKTNLLED